MQIDTKKLKKAIILNLPFVIFWYIGDIASFAYRISDGSNFTEKLRPFFDNLIMSFQRIFPSFHPVDVIVGAAVALLMKLILVMKAKKRKKYRQGEEYGSARWGTAQDIEPFMDKSDFSNNVLLTQTERLTMGRPSSPKFGRNKNVLVIGGSGSGKTRFFVKPNLMQMHSSYIVTDPKGSVLVEC